MKADGIEVGWRGEAGVLRGSWYVPGGVASWASGSRAQRRSRGLTRRQWFTGMRAGHQATPRFGWKGEDADAYIWKVFP